MTIEHPWRPAPATAGVADQAATTSTDYGRMQINAALYDFEQQLRNDLDSHRHILGLTEHSDPHVTATTLVLIQGDLDRAAQRIADALTWVRS